MKTNYFYVLPSILLMACSNNQYHVTINANEQTPDSTVVYITDYESKEDTIITYIINGKATFDGNINGSSIRRIYAPDTRLFANVILEPGVINVDVINGTASGTPLNDDYALYDKWYSALDNTFANRYDAIMKDSTLTYEDKNLQKDLMYEEYLQIVANNADSIISVNKNNAFGQQVFWETYVEALNGVINSEKYNKALNNAGDYIANYVPIKKATKQIINYNATQVGSKFVDFTIEHGNIDGTEAKLSDYVGKGKVVLVDFWASYCGHCRRATPIIKTVYEKYKDRNFDVLSIAVYEQRDASLKAIEEDGVTWNVIVDAQEIPTDIYGIFGIPELILFDADGTIIDRSISPSSLDSAIAHALNK